MPPDILGAGLTHICWGIAGAIALFGIDDLFVDLAAHARSTARRLTVYRRYPRTGVQTLPRCEEGWAAILLPAWQEAGVIGPMLGHLRRSLAYRRYRVFLGHYPNDGATAHAARALDPGGDWLEIVTTARPGPTSKADCLNQLWSGMRRFERRTGIEFAFLVLHDAEDLVHAAELTIFNRLIGRADLIQLPVTPLPRRWHDFVAGTYLDEFAESHQKDLALREGFAGGVPCAGVGCAVSRPALEELAAAHAGAPFPAGSLTEDYALALELLARGRRSIFVRLADRPEAYGFSCVPIVSIRAYFPDRLRDAVRQKARWLIGIALQSRHGRQWPGSPAAKYMLLRDRKAIVTPLLAAAAYLLGAAILLYEGAYATGLRAGPPLIAAGSALASLLWLNAGLLALRAGHRLVYVWRLYGWRQALLSLPRIPVANLVNCLAALRALRLYAAHRLTGRPLAWDKTRHAFPASEPVP